MICAKALAVEPKRVSKCIFVAPVSRRTVVLCSLEAMNKGLT
jgi:hypothetical protein